MKLRFTKTNGHLDKAIDQLMEAAEGIRRPDYIREMIIAALKAGRLDPSTGLGRRADRAAREIETGSS